MGSGATESGQMKYSVCQLFVYFNQRAADELVNYAGNAGLIRKPLLDRFSLQFNKVRFGDPYVQPFILLQGIPGILDQLLFPFRAVRCRNLFSVLKTFKDFTFFF